MFVIILLAAAVLSIIWGACRTGIPIGEHLSSDVQRYVGLKVAEATLRLLETDADHVVLFSAAAGRGPYAALLSSLTRKLKEHKIEADVLTPQDLGHGDDDPYADGYERILRQHKPALIVAVALGALDVQGVPTELQTFVDGGGRLVLLGEIARPESPFLDWVRQGKAVAVVRNTGPLRHLAPATTQTPGPAATPQQYFEQHYTILTAENIGRVIPGKGEQGKSHLGNSDTAGVADTLPSRGVCGTKRAVIYLHSRKLTPLPKGEAG